jgi:serine/threonine protein kinase
MAETRLGTPLTMAYEILTSDSEGYNSKADLWSVGVVYY